VVKVFLALREAFVNSFWRVVRTRVHQPFALMDGRDRSVVVSIAALTTERSEENHWSSWLGNGGRGGGGGGMIQFSSLSVMASQSASCQSGLGLLL